MENAILQYDFFPHYYTSNKDIYEPILCECLNKSKKMIDLCGGKFSLIKNQCNKQPDVIADNSGYEIDFKMMISETLKEFQSRTAPIAQEIAPGVKAFHNPPQLKKKVVLIWNCCRNIHPSQLRRVNNLVKTLCSCYDRGNCILLDDGDTHKCVQIISCSGIYCNYFKRAVLPADKELYEEIKKHNKLK